MCATLHVARTSFTRMRGLLGRRGLAEGEGLLLQPAGSIHTFFMRFPIDVVFLDREQRVVRVVAESPSVADGSGQESPRRARARRR